MRRTFPLLAGSLLLCICLNPTSLNAQEMQVSLQGGVTYNLPLGDFKATDGAINNYPTTGFAEPSFGYKIRAILNISPKIGFYAEIYRPEFNANLDAVLERLNLQPPFGDYYTANWLMEIVSFGTRFSPVKIAMAEPYIQVGIGRYKTTIYQKIMDYETTETSDITQGTSVGVGTILSFSVFGHDIGLDIGAQYHTVEFIFEGQPIGWKATWVDAAVLLSIKLGG